MIRELLDYINQQLILGVDKEEIKKELLNAGWQVNDVEEAIEKATTDIFTEAANSVEIRRVSIKKLFIVILTGVLVIGGSVWGYFYYRNKVIMSSKLPTPTISATPIPLSVSALTQTPIPSQTPVPTKTPSHTRTPTPMPVYTITPVPVIKNCDVYTYQDKFYNGIGRHCLEKVLLKGIYFVAKDQTSEIVADWQTNMKNIFQKIKSFYESQFDNKIQITIEEPKIIYGDKNIGDYSSSWPVVQEVRDKLQIKLSTNYFSDLTIYYNSPSGSYSGGGTWGSVDDNGSITTNPSFWLQSSSLCTVTTKYGTDCFGYINSGHEFGHSLGLAHPWDMDINKDSKGNIIDQNFHRNDQGNIMSYNSGPLISGDPSNPFGGYYIMIEEKQKMSVSK